MLVKSKGILISKVKYADNSYILKIFTENFGLKSFIINSPQKRGAVIKSAYLEPLSILEIDFYLKENQTLYRIKDGRLIYSPFLENEEMVRKSILFFYNDILKQFIFENQPFIDIFQSGTEFLMHFKLEQHLKYQPFQIMLKHLKFSGLFPRNNFDESSNIFNMSESEYSNIVKSPLDIKPPYAQTLSAILSEKFDILNTQERNYFLDVLLTYCKVHIPNFKEPKSLEIIREIL